MGSWGRQALVRLMDEVVNQKSAKRAPDKDNAQEDARLAMAVAGGVALTATAGAFLFDAVESINAGFALFDSEDRFVLCNSHYRNVHPLMPDMAVPGTPFEEMVRTCAEGGLYRKSESELEAFIEKRLAYHRNTPSLHERPLADGRWVEIHESKTQDGGTVLMWTDITERKRADRLQHGRNKVLERLATGASLGEVLTFLITTAEEITPGMLCSVLLVDRDGKRLLNGAAPSLPDFYNEAVDGIKIAQGAGSCGTAAHTGEVVIVEDVMTHPYWKGFRDIAAKADLRACWSHPIAAADGKVLGTFAMYYREPRKPTPQDMEIIEAAARLAGIAIEHKRMEGELREGENRFRGAVESLREAFALYDADDRLIAFNDKYQALRPGTRKILEKGCTFEELLRSNVKQGVIAEAIGREEEFIQERLEKHRNPQSTVLRRHIDGSWYILDEVKTPDGGTALSFTDVTELKKAEEELRESETRLRAIIDHLPVGFYAKDLEGRHLIVNKMYLERHGLAEEQIVGKVNEEIFPENKENNKASREQEKEVVSGKKTVIREQNKVFKDGTEHTLLVSKFPIMDAAGNVKAVGMTGVDMTEIKKANEALRRSEERFRDFSESSSDWFWEMDKNLRFSYFSHRFAEISGIKNEDLIGKTRWESGLDLENPMILQNIANLEAHRPFRDFEHSRTLKNGDVVHMSTSGIPIFDEDGNFKGYRGTGKDISDRVRAEEDRRLALVQAEEANQSKSEFLATISHELRTPLNAILGFAEILSHQYLGPLGQEKYVEYAGDIHASGEYLLELVNDVLDISTIEAGKRSLSKEMLSVHEAIDESTKTIAGRAAEKDISLSVKVPEDLPFLLADRRAVKQILLNLLSNSIKFTPNGGEVSVSARGSKRKITIMVTDTGIGIPKERIPRLMDPFERGDVDPYISQDGAGLGLAITHSLVELHDGELKIKSTQGKGTTVTVSFPRT